MKYDAIDKKQFGIKCGTKKVLVLCTLFNVIELIYVSFCCSKSDATDIDCGEQYRKFVKKSVLVDTSSAQPKRVMVWLDTEEVKRVFKSVSLFSGDLHVDI